MTIRSKIMHVLLKSGMSDSREEVVEEEVSIDTNTSCQTTLMQEDGPSLFQYRRGPKSHHKLQNCL